MLIHLSELSQAEGKVVEQSVTYGKDYLTVTGVDYPIKETLSSKFILSCISKGHVHIEGDYSLVAIAPCDRCLDDVCVPVQVSFSEDIDVEEMGEELDTDELLYKEFLMKWPMKILCDDNCKGICQKCGSNLNHGDCGCDQSVLDPRMAAILDLFNNSKS